MSSNLSVINFTVGGTLTISGKTTLAESVLSSSSVDIQGLTTTSLNTTGVSTFNGSLPTSTQTPTLSYVVIVVLATMRSVWESIRFK
jgi:hypothetical protein